MDIIELRDFCMSLPAATEDMPFDETTVCFRVGNKIFGITDTEDKPLKIALKCKPELVPSLRERFSSIKPGYHLNKIHWNTIDVEGDLRIDLLKLMIRHSYTLIFNSLRKKDKTELLANFTDIQSVLVDDLEF